MAISIYILIGYPEYIIKDKILYRKSYKVKSKLVKWKYFNERKINISTKDNKKGYYLVKNNIRKFHSLISLKHRLKQAY